MKHGFVALLFILLPSPFTLLPSDLHADTLAENQARLGVLTGDVGLLSQGASEWIEPHEGLPLESGDRIRTGENSQAEILMGENVFWTLGAETELVTERMETNRGRFNFTQGTLRGMVDSARLAGIAQSWIFNTPGSVVAIRGTEFALLWSKEDGARVGVFEGIVEVQPAETAEGQQPVARVSAGQEAVAKRGKSLQVLSAFSPKMDGVLAGRRSLRARLKQVENTWSPFTPALRVELRKKFVAPAPKPRAKPPRPARKPRRSAPPN